VSSSIQKYDSRCPHKKSCSRLPTGVVACEAFTSPAERQRQLGFVTHYPSPISHIVHPVQAIVNQTPHTTHTSINHHSPPFLFASHSRTQDTGHRTQGPAPRLPALTDTRTHSTSPFSPLLSSRGSRRLAAKQHSETDETKRRTTLSAPGSIALFLRILRLMNHLPI
jgi:hypothetical protein